MTDKGKKPFEECEAAEQQRGGFRILLAEDVIINQQLALIILGELGLTADVVVNGVEVLEALKSTSYDLVLMDMQMPVMDGLEATRAIRAPESAVRNRGIPIIAMTGSAVGGDREKCFEAGMDDYIAKPSMVACLGEVLEKWLGRLAPGGEAGRPPSRALEISGVDVAAGLVLCGSNEQQYRTLLGRFAANHAQQGRIIRQALQAGAIEVAVQAAHKLQGIAGNLAVTGVYETVTQVHEALRNGELPDGAQIAKLEQQLELCVTAIRQAGCSAVTAEGTEESERAPRRGLDELLRILADLGEALEQGDASARQLLRLLHAPLAARGMSAEAQELFRLVTAYDYEGGQVVLARINSGLSAAGQDTESSG